MHNRFIPESEGGGASCISIFLYLKTRVKVHNRDINIIPESEGEGASSTSFFIPENKSEGA